MQTPLSSDSSSVSFAHFHWMIFQGVWRRLRPIPNLTFKSSVQTLGGNTCSYSHPPSLPPKRWGPRQTDAGILAEEGRLVLPTEIRLRLTQENSQISSHVFYQPSKFLTFCALCAGGPIEAFSPQTGDIHDFKVFVHPTYNLKPWLEEKGHEKPKSWLHTGLFSQRARSSFLFRVPMFPFFPAPLVLTSSPKFATPWLPGTQSSFQCQNLR